MNLQFVVNGVIKSFLIIISINLTGIFQVAAQSGIDNKSSLTVKEIMTDSLWFNRIPESPFWAENGKELYFNWNKPYSPVNDLYEYSLITKKIQKTIFEKKSKLSGHKGIYNKAKTKKVYVKNGDIFLHDIESGTTTQITKTIENESSPVFSFKENKVLYIKDNDLYEWHIKTGVTTQLVHFSSGFEPANSQPYANAQEEWLYKDQLNNFKVLKRRKENDDKQEKDKELNNLNKIKTIYTNNAFVYKVNLSPDERFITYSLFNSKSDVQRTDVPNYVTISGFTENIPSREKVGGEPSWVEMFVFDRQNDTIYGVQTDEIDGIKDFPEYYKDHERKNDTVVRKCVLHGPVWSDDGKNAIIQARSVDHKDRWFMLLNPVDGSLKTLNRQHDTAWIGGPGIDNWGFSSGNWGWMPDNKNIWFQSEETGYSHIYTVNAFSGKKKALTKGKYEIRHAQISKDKKHWYFISNEIHPGERHLYRMPIKGGKTEKLTSMSGNNQVFLSPDEKMIALLHSNQNTPWELYLKENRKDAKPIKITSSLSDKFRAYNWRKPEVIIFKAGDNANVYARLYKPEPDVNNKAAVIFVHGAGYLQNAHKWWSTYSHEYMFHNLLADNGYTILDIDYRGSDGYGRDWRTGIYRHMGGKDLSDQVDGVKYLIENHGVNPDKIGIYGGSYGGFITLMAMFKAGDTFKSGAALRSVADWAHYNHGYTSNILNTPVLDSLAFVKSSPIYYAEGLKGNLLICHGMLDVNVHFQDVVRLAQRLIELGKDNWELAVFPLEDHSFVEPESWTDEYKRIFKLFQQTIGNNDINN